MLYIHPLCRFSYLFNNEILSDVHFLVGKEPGIQRIPAHKLILTAGSAVFDAMFNGTLATHAPEVELPDVEPTAFLSLLRLANSLSVIRLTIKSSFLKEVLNKRFVYVVQCYRHNIRSPSPHGDKWYDIAHDRMEKILTSKSTALEDSVGTVAPFRRPTCPFPPPSNSP